MTRASILRARRAINKWIKTEYGVLFRRKHHKNQRDRIRRVLAALKEANPCCDCGRYDPHFLMDFDHRDGRGKEDRTLARFTSWRRALVELGKVDIVCVRCHRIRENDRLGCFGRHKRKT